MAVNPELGQRIRESRQRAGFSQERLAELVGTHRRHVIRWEQGLHRPTGVYAERLADVLEERREEFLRDEDEEAVSDLVSELVSSLRKIVAAELKRERKSAEAVA